MIGAYVRREFGHSTRFGSRRGDHLERTAEEQAAHVAVGVDFTFAAPVIVAQDDDEPPGIGVLGQVGGVAGPAAAMVDHAAVIIAGVHLAAVGVLGRFVGCGFAGHEERGGLGGGQKPVGAHALHPAAQVGGGGVHRTVAHHAVEPGDVFVALQAVGQGGRIAGDEAVGVIGNGARCVAAAVHRRAAHAEGAEDVFVQKLPERLSTDALHERGEQEVAGITVLEALPRFEIRLRRIGAEDVEHDPIGHRPFGIGVIGREAHVVGQAAGVVQQVPHRDGGVVAQLGQVIGHRLVQIDLAPVG